MMDNRLIAAAEEDSPRDDIIALSVGAITSVSDQSPVSDQCRVVLPGAPEKPDEATSARGGRELPGSACSMAVEFRQKNRLEVARC